MSIWPATAATKSKVRRAPWRRLMTVAEGRKLPEIDPTSDHGVAELAFWLHRYNGHRPHGETRFLTPISRLGLGQDNPLRLHI